MGAVLTQTPTVTESQNKVDAPPIVLVSLEAMLSSEIYLHRPQSLEGDEVSRLSCANSWDSGTDHLLGCVEVWISNYVYRLNISSEFQTPAGNSPSSAVDSVARTGE